MAQTRYYSSSARKTILVDPVDATATQLIVTGAVGYPATFPFTLILDRDSIEEEVVECTGLNGDTFTVTRGVDGTSAVAHAAGATVEHGTSARDFREADQHRSSAEHVHGIELGSEVVGTTDKQTLTNKTLENATFVNPNIEIQLPDGETPSLNLPGNLNMQDYRIINLGDPVDDQDGVNKRYIEDRIPELTGDDVALARDWAIKMDGLVAGEDYSSKYYAGESSASATASAESASASADSASESAQSAADAAASAANASQIWKDFEARYLGAHDAPPAVDGQGEPLQPGALYYNTVEENMYIYDGDVWIAASSASVQTLTTFEFLATEGQTDFSGTDLNGLPLQFDSDNAQVFLNGVLMSPGDDYTTSAGTVTLLEPASVNDVLNVVAFTGFVVADHYTKPEADAEFAPLDKFNVPAANELALRPDGTNERMRIKNNGAVLIGTTSLGSAGAGDLVVNGGVFLGGNAAANELDDYEEGTWTPTYEPSSGSFASITYGTFTGYYVKVGRLVWLGFSIWTEALSLGTAAGVVRVGGLPFSQSSLSAGSVGRANNWASNNPLNIDVQSDLIRMWSRSTADAVDVELTPSDMSTATASFRNLIIASLVYQTA